MLAPLAVGCGGLEAGKASPDILEQLVYGRLGVWDASVLVGPSYGEDAAIIRVAPGLVLVIHSDPITAASRHAGWLAVNVASNDVAVRGARPRWLLSTILLPQGGWRLLEGITAEIHEAARGLGVMVVGGHTEASPGLENPIIVATASGVAREGSVVTTSGVKPGDLIVMTKTAAVEGTAIMASDYEEELLARGVPREVVRRASEFIWRVSVVREALALAEEGLVDAMHDPTEGGILGGVAEMAYASGVRVRVYEDRIPLAGETVTLARALGVDPLRLISSGSLLAAVPRRLLERALRLLESLGVEASVIGEALEPGLEPGVELVRRDGSVVEIPRHVPDEIYRLALEVA
jgi:hydrogenase expression/formation protein HypE